MEGRNEKKRGSLFEQWSKSYKTLENSRVCHVFFCLSACLTWKVRNSTVREGKKTVCLESYWSQERNLMEYERIDKVQSGISPSKLRMKLMGPHHHRKKDGSNSNSSRTSPSRIEDSEFVDSLLASKNGDFDEEVPSLDVAAVKVSNEVVSDSSLNDQISSQPKESLPRESVEVCHAQLQQFSKGVDGNTSAIHPMRTLEDENLDYDSNASSSSFEFHKGEKAVHSSMTRSYSRPMSSKWNDAEKWIMNRQNVQATYSKKSAFHNQANRFPMTNMGRVAPESANYDQRLAVNRIADTKRVDFCQAAVQMPFEKFSFTPSGAHPISAQACGGNLLSDQCPQSTDLREVAQWDLSCIKSSAEDTTVLPAIRSVSMRDTGTEMTPVTSQEPSRTATPVGATTPLRSPTSSIPSTPRRGAPASTPLDHATDNEPQHPADNGKKELSEQEMKLKTRTEIVALGVQLGKMNIAAWASKDEKENITSSVETSNIEELEQIEYEKRAAAWEEAEKSKHASRYKCEEIKIQAWESQQRAKLEAEMRRIELVV
ncbi:uncharacterized protein LOC111278071 isoform X2 [Durio zibethinus]|uniref:Uncharacterized protein LOC111278071 isoform X2 n=1 Tax=Durio zibethinus TaxID=66656 RepID=A0A6P5WVY0_DURZI|nr:uncharacterized protein LOC111278071 isoform X2 [Durio zibethinus]XP_022720246.1 uncharacterized protein LOC111278071 isoform X2 [Durio zibethinus]